MNPYWAGWAVAMISLPATAGQSIHKGVLRMGGTIPGCLAALVILSLAPQSRWGFMVLVSAWIFFTTYMMIRSRNSVYFWNVAGFVCLVILLAGPTSSQNAFEHAVFRTVETAMGIVVYTLITVFLWPRNSAGAIKKASGELVATQAELFRVGGDVMAGRGTEEKLPGLHTKEVQQLGQLAQALQAEGSESYEVHEVRHLWEGLHGLSAALMESLDRWQAGLGDLARIDAKAALPDLPAFFGELDARFEEIQRLLGGSPPAREAHAVALTVDGTGLHGLSHLDRAALAVTRKELESLETLTRSMLDCARGLAGEFAETRSSEPISPPVATRRGSRLPVVDLDHLRGATFAAACTAGGFLIWIFFNPVGHDGWWQTAGTAAMAVGVTQQMRISMVVQPLALASAIGLAAYVFIMPQLSSFLGLGLLIFLCMFIACYFFSGLARFVGIVAILNEISVQNQQTYNFAAMANGFLFMVLVLFFVFAMSYMIRSARPEKAVLHLQARFFRSAEFLMSRMELEPGPAPSLVERWKAAFYRYEMKTLPQKLGVWGRTIDQKKFPNTRPEQVQALVTSLQVLVYRMEELLDAGSASGAEPIMRELRDDIEAWRQEIAKAFARWSDQPEAQPGDEQRDGLKAWVSGLEAKLGEAVERARGRVSEEEGEAFYRVLGGYRGVSAAAVAYAGAAGRIDWAQWREERF